MGQRIALQSDEQWHGLRRTHTGSSDTACLYADVGYRSEFEYFNTVIGVLPPLDLTGDERATLGKHMEPAIAGAASELFGYELRKADYYLIDDVQPRMAATLDYEWIDENGVVSPCEIKNVAWEVYKDTWIIHDDGYAEPPLRFSIQVQTQIACANATKGLLIALIAGNRLVRCEIPRHEEAIADIRRRVGVFWESVANNTPPPAQMPRDLGAAKVAWDCGQGVVDLRGDPDVEGWLQQLRDLRSHRANVQYEIDTVEGQILAYCRDHGFSSITANNGRISAKRRKAKEAHMVQHKAQPEKTELRITT